MNKGDITNAFFETVVDSLEWVDVFDDKKEYLAFLNGAIATTNKMIDMYCNEDVNS